MDERKLSCLPSQHDNNNWHEYVNNVDNNLVENETSWELLSQEPVTSQTNNGINDESKKLNHSFVSSNDSLKTILTIDENKELSINDNNYYEASDSNPYLCLKALRDSNYNIKLHKYLYPIPEDPGLVPGFWVLYPKPPSYDNDGVDKFKHLAGIMKLQPIGRMPEILQSNKIDLQYYGVNPKLVRAICEAAFNNNSVHTLDLQDNWLTVDACYHLNYFLVHNNILSCLNLSGCRIGPRGAKRLEEGIGTAPALRFLNVSGCDLGDEGMTYISIGVYCSSSIQIVILQNNNLSDESGMPLQTMLTQSDSLRELNLSWNSLFNYKFWIRFYDGLNRNITLTHLDLSWNSLGNECILLLTKYLSSSTNLRGINLNGNRFESKEAIQIAEALMKNTTLEELHLKDNPMEYIGANAIINAMAPRASPHSQLRLLNLENIWASKDIVSIMTDIKNNRPKLNIKIGGILSNHKIIGPDSRKIFLKRANFVAMKPKKIKRRRNFGQFVLSLDDSIITKDNFQKLVKRYKLKLSKSLVNEIMDAFAIGADAVDQGALKKFYLREYPDTHPAPSKPKKKKIKKITKKKNNEEIQSKHNRKTKKKSKITK